MLLKQTLLSFTLPLATDEVRAFRGAMAEKAGLGNDLFHNHDNSRQSAVRSPQSVKQHYHHRYPLIQYGSFKKQAMITGLNQGSDELHAFIDRYDGKLKIMREVQPMKIKKHLTQQFELALTDEYHRYRIWRWLLRTEKLDEWNNEPRHTKKLQKLEGWLSNSIINFASGIGWRIPGRFELYLTDNPKSQSQTTKRKLRYLAFDVDIATNLILPPLIGLGKSASEGYGRLYPRSYSWEFG